ncbi:MAG: YdeI/OmpD-associated family protein [Terriglobia bacterium]
MKLTFFRTPSNLQKWFAKNHSIAGELWVGFYKTSSGKPSITWPESVDEALCYGWIDGIRKSVDAFSYAIRFTPRRPGSIWSHVNIKRARALAKQQRMQPNGLRAFRARKENKSGIYSYEQRRDQLEEPYASFLRKNEAAWNFFQAQRASYRKAIGWWVVSAKREETRLKRLEKLIQESECGCTLYPPARGNPLRDKKL